MTSLAAQRQLANALKKSHKEPIEGFCVELLNDDDLFKWKIYLEGPKDSPYEGGIFQAIMKFPPEYPMLPPSLQFTSEFWHPNVYPDGRVCISILHAPGEDAMSGELPEERWLPTQTVGTVLLSVISMLNDPNTSSPANVDASVMWRNDRPTYLKKCAELVEKANKEMPEGIVIPHPDTNPEERQKELDRMKAQNETVDFYDDEEEEEDFFPESGEDGNSVNSAFYDSDDGSEVDEAEIWKENSDDIEQSDSDNEPNTTAIEKENNDKNEENSIDDSLSEEKEEITTKKKEEIKKEEVKNEQIEENDIEEKKKETKSEKMGDKDKIDNNSSQGNTDSGKKSKKKECYIM